MKVGRIKLNKLRCGSCGGEITSKHRHDFRWCKCGAVAVDGGNEYLRRVGNFLNATELSEYELEEQNKDA